MINMKNFAAQQLTKKQMNEVKGGTVHITCAIVNAKNELVAIAIIEGRDMDEAVRNLNAEVYPGERATDCDVF